MLILHLSAISFDKANAETLLFAPIQTAFVSQMPLPTQIQIVHVSESPISTSNQNIVPGTFEDSNNNLNNASLSDENNDRE